MGDIEDSSDDSKIAESKTAESIPAGQPEKKDTKEDSSVFSSRLTAISAFIGALLGIANLYTAQRISTAEQHLKEFNAQKEAWFKAQTIAIEELKQKSASNVEEHKERVARYEFVFKLLSPLAKTPEAQLALAKHISRLALESNEQEILNDLPASSQSPRAQLGHELATERNKWPIYVDRTMIVGCVTRGGNDKCVGDRITLGGRTYNRGVVFTQSFPQAATATIRIPDSARSFSFTVGDYWTGGDCGGQRPMQVSITADGKLQWGPVPVSSVPINDVIPLPVKARFLVLRGDSGDGDTRCDDSVWVDTHFQ